MDEFENPKTKFLYYFKLLSNQKNSYSQHDALKKFSVNHESFK